MADEPQTIRGIDWRETFPFTHLFRAFRVAIHPSKIVLAVVALLLLYAGGHVLDWMWPVADRAVPGEVVEYERFATHARAGQPFAGYRQGRRAEIEAAYQADLLRYKLAKDDAVAAEAAKHAEKLGEVKNAIKAERDQAREDADKQLKVALDGAGKLTGPAADQARKEARAARDAAVRLAYAGAAARRQADCRIKNLGLFDVFFEYESSQVSNVVNAVRGGNWFGEEEVPADSDDQLTRVRALIGTGGPGVIQSVVRFFTVGPIWLLTEHTVYFFLLGAWFLIVWSIFGGAICRIAAVHVARDEKLSIRSALVFSAQKFLSFLFAPIIPLIIISGVGVLVAVVALLGNIPGIGPIAIGLTFILALAAGFVMALVLVGLIGGFNLMYPTIAVEGSDSFDAISRSFSYLYARPWRLAFYTVVSIVYGAACYLFVKLFIYLLLVITHRFVSLGIFTSAESTAPLLSAMWPSPSTAARLTYDVDGLNLTFAQEIAARLIWFWVHMVIAVLGAFAVSFYFAASTITYFLMRKEVDATDTDDVFLEQPDDEFAEAPPASGGVPVPEKAEAADDVSPPT